MDSGFFPEDVRARLKGGFIAGGGYQDLFITLFVVFSLCLHAVSSEQTWRIQCCFHCLINFKLNY